MAFRIVRCAGKTRGATALVMTAAISLLLAGMYGCNKTDSTPVLPDPPAADGDGGGAGAQVATGDEIPAGEILWYGPNIAGWKTIGKLDALEVNLTYAGNTLAPTICWKWQTPRWPAVNKGVIGTQWIIAKIGGKWVATTWEFLTGASQMCRQTEANNASKGGHPGDPPFIQGGAGPILVWRPQKGEEVGFVNSTIARGPAAPGGPHERTYIKKIIWP